MRAFQKGYDYYRLKKDCLGLKHGAIFYHDKEDHKLGSHAEGCLKLAWDVDGNCNFGACGDAYILHASARKDEEYLEKIDIDTDENIIKILLDKINIQIDYLKNTSGDYNIGNRNAYINVRNLLTEIQAGNSK